MKQEMLINVSQPEECRIAIVEDGVLEELYVERTGQDNYVGNIYKGVVVNLEPSIQAAFVDFGVGRNGFLHISDVEPQYFRQGGYDPDSRSAPDGPAPRPPRTAADDGDDVDDESTTSRRRPAARGLSVPAPARASSRPSRKSSAAATKCWCRSSRKASAPRARRCPPTSASPAATWCSCRRWAASASRGRSRTRTSAAGCATSCSSSTRPRGWASSSAPPASTAPRSELHRDLAYLLRLWKVIVRRIKKCPRPVEIYQESDMIIRTIRDIFTSDIDTICIDEKAAYEQASEFLQLVMPRYVHRLQLYEGKEPLFHKYGIDEEIARIQQRKVPLEGGRLDRHRPDRGPGGHRRQQRQLPRRRQRRGDRLPDEPAGGQGDRPATPPPRPGRRDRQRLHRHAQGEAPPRRRAGAARRRASATGPGPRSSAPAPSA